MRQWWELKIAETDLSDLLDELSPVVCGAPKRAGWVANWVLDGVLAELEEACRDEYFVGEQRKTELQFEYVPQRRMYVRWHGQYRGVGY